MKFALDSARSTGNIFFDSAGNSNRHGKKKKSIKLTYITESDEENDDMQFVDQTIDLSHRTLGIETMKSSLKQ